MQAEQMNGQHQNAVVQPASQPDKNLYEKYPTQQSMGLGITQIVIGVLCIILNSVAIVIDAHLASIGHGIWCGLLFILSGSFGIAASRNKTACMIIPFMTLSIISAVFCAPLLIIASTGVDKDNGERSCFFGFCYTVRHSQGETKIAMNGTMVALSLLELIVAIWSSAICCGATCCGSQARTGVVLNTQGQAVHYISGGTPHVVVYSGGQAISYGQGNMGNLQPQYIYQQQGAYGGHYPQPAQANAYGYTSAPMAPNQPPAYNHGGPPVYNPPAETKQAF